MHETPDKSAPNPMCPVPLIILLALALLKTSVVAGDVVQVTGSRVNLRAKASTSVEAVGQVEQGDLLFVKSLGAEWVEVVPPEGVAVWVSRDYVKDGFVTVASLNVRSGPGVNYAILGKLARDAKVDAGEEFGEWLKISPPDQASVWISRQYIKEVTPLISGPASVVELPVFPGADHAATEQPQVDEAGIDSRSTELPSVRPVPSDLKLVPLEGQGRLVVVKGKLKKSGLSFRPPSRFRLLHLTESNDDNMICFVRGNEEQLKELTNSSMSIHGRQYWVHNCEYPVVIPEKIILPKEGSL